MSPNDLPLNKPVSETNHRQVRPHIWLLAAGSALLLLLVILGVVLIRPAPADGTAVNEELDPTAEPLQTPLTGHEPSLWQGDDLIWRMHPRAEFTITARIIGRQRYYDWMAAFIPYDLQVAWGDLSNPDVDRWISWGQASRFAGFYESRGGPFTKSYLANHTANIHIIPATKNLEQAVKGLRRNDIVLLEGILVDVQSSRGNMETSLTRSDSGTGATEILYLRRVVMAGMEYR